MAPLCFPKVIQINYNVNVKNGITLTCAKFGADLINTSKVTNCKTKLARFYAPLCTFETVVMNVCKR